MVTINQVRQRSGELKEQGEKLLVHLDLITTLTTFGEVWLIGSYSYDLMQVPDIDFRIYCKTLDRNAIRNFAHSMTARSDVLGIRLLDFSKVESIKNNIHLVIYVNFENEVWKLDLLFVFEEAELSHEPFFK
jgi:hypothetical protein